VKSPNTASNGSAHMVYKWARTSSCRLMILTIPELVRKMFGILSPRRAASLLTMPADWFREAEAEAEAERVFIAAPVSSKFIRLTVRSKFTLFRFFFFVLGERRMDRFEEVNLERLGVASPSLPISELRRGPAAAGRFLGEVESTAGDMDLTDPNLFRADIAMFTAFLRIFLFCSSGSL